MKPRVVVPKLISMTLALGLASLAHAEQLRIVVGKPEIVAATRTTNESTGLAALWQSLLSLELSKRELFAVVEREDLPALLQEWELAAGQRHTNSTSPAKAALLGADCLLVSKLSVRSNVCALALKLLNAERGTVEKEWTERRAVRQVLSELAAENQDITACNQAVLEGALMLDRMEEEDARRSQG